MYVLCTGNDLKLKQYLQIERLPHASNHILGTKKTMTNHPSIYGHPWYAINY